MQSNAPSLASSVKGEQWHVACESDTVPRAICTDHVLFAGFFVDEVTYLGVAMPRTTTVHDEPLNHGIGCRGKYFGRSRAS